MEEEVFCFPSHIAKHRLVLLHGWGADAEDLLPVGKQLIDDISENIELVSFRASQEHPQGLGRQWYSLFPTNWKEAEQSVIQLRLRLLSLSTLEIPLEKTVLFGFSQGAAMAMAVGLRLPLAGLVICSGYPHKDLRLDDYVPPVFFSHGYHDPIVPVQATKELIKLCDQKGITPQIKLFEGAHEIPEEIYGEIRLFLRKCFI